MVWFPRLSASFTLNERKQNDEKDGERTLVRQIRWLAASSILRVSEHYENRIIFTILFTLQESRYRLISCFAKGFAVESTASPLDASDLVHPQLSFN